MRRASISLLLVAGLAALARGAESAPSAVPAADA